MLFVQLPPPSLSPERQLIRTLLAPQAPWEISSIPVAADALRGKQSCVAVCVRVCVYMYVCVYPHFPLGHLGGISSFVNSNLNP